MLSKAAKRYHIATAGQECCPFCKAEIDSITNFNVEYEELEPVEGGDVEQKVHCLRCGKRWKDVFRLVEVHELC